MNQASFDRRDIVFFFNVTTVCPQQNLQQSVFVQHAQIPENERHIDRLLNTLTSYSD